MSTITETAYAANRSPTGHATALLVTRPGPGHEWTYLPDEGGARRTLHGPEPLYATAEEAVLAARWRWRCNQGRPRQRKPVPIDHA